MLNIQNISIRHAKGNLNETSYLHLLRNKKSQKLSLNKKLKQSIFYLKYHLCNIFRVSASASIKLVHKIFLFGFVSNLGKAIKAKTKKNDSLCHFTLETINKKCLKTFSFSVINRLYINKIYKIYVKTIQQLGVRDIIKLLNFSVGKYSYLRKQ